MVNKTGKWVLQMCKGFGLYIVNGRIRGDSLGRLTQRSVLGSSVVDYAITDTEPQYINAFTVSPQQPLTDRSQITLFLKKSLSTTVNPNPEPRLFPLQEIQMDRREHCCLYLCTRLKSGMKQKERWFDKECTVSRQNLRKLSNRKHRNQSDLMGQLEYIQALKDYKRLLHVKKNALYGGRTQ